MTARSDAERQFCARQQWHQHSQPRCVDEPTVVADSRAAAAAMSVGCTAEFYEPAHQKEYTERDGEDVPAAQAIMDCVEGVGHDDEQPDEH